jgi:hypothetical protein
MEVDEGPNWECSAKEKKITVDGPATLYKQICRLTHAKAPPPQPI